MNTPTLRVSSPLTMRLLRRTLFVCALLILLFAGLFAWWKYRTTLDAADQLMTEVGQTMSVPLANSLWNFNVELLGEQLEGLRSAPNISYAAVLEHGHVLVENGARKTSDVLTHTVALAHRREGQVTVLGELVLQADLAQARNMAVNAALVSLAFNSGMVLLVSLAIFLLTRAMISRHLTTAAHFFQSLNFSQENMPLPKLHLDKKWAGDELDILCLAVNNMQENVSSTFTKALMAEHEAKSQARFPAENPNPVLRVAADGLLLSANPASETLLADWGCSLGQRLPEQYMPLLRNAFSSGLMQQFEAELNDRAYLFAARPFPSDGYMNIYGMDITRRAHAEEEVRRNMARLQCLVRVLQHTGVCAQDFLDFCLKEGLALTESRFGYIYHYSEERQEFVLNSWSTEAMQACDVTDASHRYQLKQTGIWGEVVRQRRAIILNEFPAAHPLKRGYPEGHVYLRRFMSVPVFHAGKLVGVAGVANKDEDYSDSDVMQLTLLMDACWQMLSRMAAENDVRRSLQEKKILLKEIHHRVKNNLQVVSSLLFLQMEYVTNPSDRELFSESQKRIQAMALVHEELYGAEDLSSVNMRDYVSRLVERVLASADIPVRAQFDLEEVSLPVTRSIPCGLALNELVMNAVKHAFRPNRDDALEGLLRVSLRQADGRIVLEVEDNGPGLPPDFDILDTPTLGMTLVTSLVHQLQGELTAKNTVFGGACFRLTFLTEPAKP